jgi:hypothetical protein
LVIALREGSLINANGIDPQRLDVGCAELHEGCPAVFRNGQYSVSAEDSPAWILRILAPYIGQGLVLHIVVVERNLGKLEP